MIFRLYNFENDLYFSENTSGALLIENKELFVNIIDSLYIKMEGFEPKEEMNFFENDKIINAEKKILFLFDLFQNILKKRTTINKLAKRIEEDLNKDYDKKLQIDTRINNLYNKIDDFIREYNFEIEIDEKISMTSLLKAMNLNINITHNKSAFERIYDILRIVSELDLYKIVVIVNAHTVFNNLQIKEIVKICNYINLPLIFVENTVIIEPFKGTNILYVDKMFDEKTINSCYNLEFDS